ARTVTFNLSRPDPDFLSNMASIGTAPIPPEFPLNDGTGQTPIPGTGPYKVASENEHAIRYVRNPYFHERSHIAQPDGHPKVVVMRGGLSHAQEVQMVEQGKADWTGEGVPGPLLADVLHRFPGQWHSLLTSQTDFFRFNTTIAPFNDIGVR